MQASPCLLDAACLQHVIYALCTAVEGHCSVLHRLGTAASDAGLYSSVPRGVAYYLLAAMSTDGYSSFFLLGCLCDSLGTPCQVCSTPHSRLLAHAHAAVHVQQTSMQTKRMSPMRSLPLPASDGRAFAS